MSIDVVVGGQYGSEGKGGVAAHLMKRRRQEDPLGTIHAVRVAGPNAGHTAVGILDGEHWALRQVPCMAVADLTCQLHIAQGSEVDIPVLLDEIARLDAAGYKVSDRLDVSVEATVIESEHKELEAGLVAKLGSTAKGIGAARAARAMRTARRMCDIYDDADVEPPFQPMAPLEPIIWLANDEHVIIEGTQGYGLGTHVGMYPQCTSSDCTSADFLAMAGIPPGAEVTTWVCFRSYPIRVAGNSGEMGDELTWEELAERTGGHVKPERTTVTKKVRRVAEWDPNLAVAAYLANGGRVGDVRPVLTFADYIEPSLYEVSSGRFDLTADWGGLIEWVDENFLGGAIPPAALTTGPDSIVWCDGE